MPATSVRERAIKAYVKAYPDHKNSGLFIGKKRSKKIIFVSNGNDKLSWSYKDGTLKRV